MRIRVPLLTIALCAAPLAPAFAQAPPAVRLHTHAADARSYDANAFWLESTSGLVLIDALMLKSDARLLAAAMKATGKPLAGILITHPHLDHFGGVRTVIELLGPTPVYATRATAAAIRPTHDKAMAEGWPKAHGADYDAEPWLPDRVVESGARVELAGLRFELRDYGPMEAANNTVIHNLDLNVLFAGDATVAHAPFYVGEGRSRQSIEALERLARDFPGVRRVYSGHYGPMPLAPLVARNLEDVRAARAIVAAGLADRAQLDADGALKPAARAAAVRALAARMRAQATYGMSARTIATLNLAGLEAELKAEGTPTPATGVARPEAMRAELRQGLARLDFITGRWAGTAARPEATPTPAEVTFAPGPGASHRVGEMRLDGYGYAFTLGYDLFQKRYRLAVVDDVTGLVDVFQGGFDASAALVLTNVEAGTHYRAGADVVHTRLTFRSLPDDRWQWEIADSRDGGRTWRVSRVFAAEKRLP
jgi:glyoxylase-like metal-dependent hydrolase (beta-lactamase superfamily II)